MAVLVNRTLGSDNTISFVHLLASSSRFADLFAEGMALVEEAAEYLDGPGRPEANRLAKTIAIAYSAESMRLTTRLMQIASWLLIRRAIAAGEMTPAEASSDRIKVRISAQNMVASPPVFEQLPERLKDLTQRSLRLQTRILHLDRMVNGTESDETQQPRRGIDMHFDLLRSAFPSSMA